MKEPLDRPLSPDAKTPLPRGFRNEPRPLSAADLAAANERRKRFGEPPFEPAKVLVERIRTEKRATLEQLEIWAEHPDERVPVAMLDHLELGRRAWITILPVVGRLVARALDEAGDDIWTPLIERLFALHLWPTSAYDLDYAAPDPATRRRLVQKDEYLLKRVLPWVEAQTTPEVFIPIVRAFRANDLLRMIAHNASHVTTELADALVERTPLAVLWLSARTKGVSPVTRRHLMDRLVPLALDFGSSGFRGGINSTEIVQAYVLLQDASCLPTMAQVERLIRRLENDLKNGTRATREASDPNSQDDPVFGLLQYYIAATGDEKLAKRYIEVAEGLAEPKRVIHLLQPPLKYETAIRHSIPTARAALKAFGDDGRVCRVVAENRLFRANPEIRKVLLRSDSVDVAVQLAKDGRPEEFEHLFRFFVTRDPSYAALLIKRQPDVARAVLQPSDLAPLLTCSDRRARMVAITFLGELTADGPSVRQANPRV